jgi:hypothetical protein
MKDLEKNVVFDLETYSLQVGAVILTMGATVFRWDDNLSFEQYRDSGLHVKLDRQQQRRRHTCLDTMDWWDGNQGRAPSAQARDVALSDNPIGCSPQAFGQTLEAWATLQGLDADTKWWCRGPHFDAAILMDFAEQYSIRLPFGYWQVRDVRTFLDEFEGKRLQAPDTMVEHNGLDDSAWEAYQMTYWRRRE